MKGQNHSNNKTKTPETEDLLRGMKTQKLFSFNLRKTVPSLASKLDENYTKTFGLYFNVSNEIQNLIEDKHSVEAVCHRCCDFSKYLEVEI